MKKIVKLGVFTLVSLTMGAAFAANHQHEKSNREIISALFKVKNFQEASPYISSSYIEHDPNARPGVEGFKYYLDTRAKEYPDYKVTIERIIADGDIVAVYAHEVLKPGDKGNALVDIYKLKNGKIIEHWDVIQPIQENSTNSLGMF